MRQHEKHYWRSPDEASGGSGAHCGDARDVDAWIEAPPGHVNRRDFLKAAGFALSAAATAGGCGKAPEQHVLPYLNHPEGTTPGRAAFYASVCGACEAGCGALVKCRDGRPIKIAGLPEHPLSRGGLCAAGQAALLGLYDAQRLRGARIEGRDTPWSGVDQALRARFEEVRRAGGAVRVLSRTVTSPTLQASIDRFLETFADGAHVVYDPLSVAAILDAHGATHGARVLPRYRFDRAEVIVSVEADFLGTWISPVAFTAAYSAGRRLDDNGPKMSYHVQFESRMSLTGTKADERRRIAPDEASSVLRALAGRITGEAGQSPFSEDSLKAELRTSLEALAKRLLDARGRSLVVCGSQDAEAQRLCNLINEALGNYGKTLDIRRPSMQKQGNDAALAGLLRELEEGRVAALVIIGLNPVYEIPGGACSAELLRRAGLVVYCGEREDETAAAAQFLCPDHHFLESWLDAEPVSGGVALRQPALRPLFQTRSVLESLHAWMGAPADAYDTLRAYWRDHVYPRATTADSFDTFWNRTLHDGFARLRGGLAQASLRDVPVPDPLPVPDPDPAAFTLTAYPKVGLLDGRHAYNPWLQELPDPVTKVTWDNYACLSVAAAKRLGVRDGDVVRIDAGDAALELPVCVQPGQHDRVVAVALGYGQTATARFAGLGPDWFGKRASVGEDGLVGKDVGPLLRIEEGLVRYERRGVTVTPTGTRVELACTQTHHTITVPPRLAPAGGLRRPILHETTLGAFAKDPKAGHPHAHHIFEGDLYPDDHPKRGHHWGMAVDLTACTGCGACVVACQAENNVPVVGRDEVRRKREMHWLRIDRYYSGEGDDVDVAHQPMMCQHCDNASCENVCPVLATVHTEEGLNAQVYNRCVGTRYCANNCPYKVRRFNWFTYRHDDPVENLVLNPDVTVRSRGVMEKCSFCVQRLQEAKIEAKRLGVKVTDAMTQPACQQSCPAGAIAFGDMNDPESAVSKRIASGRAFRVLDEINQRPSVTYLTLVRNRASDEAENHGRDAHATEGSGHHG
ncbi:MAG TPA: 4Fe-4S dicluster domain-containing protein [Candidatus Hydrogenedentes bacterium]|nr:4Fe-4S dicluster domain-containing protein [Candidatus Hydrogenedentota bacterium]